MHVEQGGRFSLHEQVANLPLWNRLTVVIHELQLVARERFATTARANVARPIRQENVEVLGRADPVNDVHPGLFLPLVPNGSRQRFARRDTQAQRGQIILFREALDREHGGIAGRGIIKDGGLEAVNDLEHLRRDA